ncbi:MAG TPA: hypothetical protein VFX76_17420 [Roseiflexaceae bacterium]|nr:hypothetical protein [Roseiflexaceae bacterium]
MSRFLVFARTRYDEPLSHLGELEVVREEAERIAAERYGDHWLELVLVPEEEIQWVLQPQVETAEARS